MIFLSSWFVFSRIQSAFSFSISFGKSSSLHSDSICRFPSVPNEMLLPSSEASDTDLDAMLEQFELSPSTICSFVFKRLKISTETATQTQNCLHNTFAWILADSPEIGFAMQLRPFDRVKLTPPRSSLFVSSMSKLQSIFSTKTETLVFQQIRIFK